MKAAAQTTNQNTFTPIIFLLETEHSNWYQELLNYIKNNQDIGRWKLTACDDGKHLQATTDQEKIIILPGRQVVTSENLEILVIGVTDTITYRNPSHTYIEKYSQKHLVIVPWGVGKWLGNRGKIVSKLLKLKPLHNFALGDNGGRTALWRNIPQFNQARKAGINILAGSDPLPIKGQQTRLGTYGTVTKGPLTDSNLLHQLKQKLLQSDANDIDKFGKPCSLFSFILSQILLRIRPIHPSKSKQI